MIQLVFLFKIVVDIVNVIGAKEFGWKEICHYVEDTNPPVIEGIHQVHHLTELRDIYPHLFRRT
jgi:hypothetical protein